MYKNFIAIFLTLIFIYSCNNINQSKETDHKDAVVILQKQKIDTTLKIDADTSVIVAYDTSDLEKIFIKAGLVNVQKLDSSIKVDLRYASTRNFLGFNMYGNIKNAYLQAYVAQKLVKASKYLHDTFPSYNLLIWDAARPLSIQQMMWDSIKVPHKLRPKYLSNPKYGSLHCFGAAVDITIVDSTGKPLDMGTDFDSFKKIAYPVLEDEFLRSGKISQNVVNNRKLLRKVMEKAGFFNIQTEWWHFNSCYRKEARKKYAMILKHKLPKTQKLIAENITAKQKETKNNNIDVWYRVQIKTSTRKLSVKNKIFKGLDVYRYYHEGLYKYTVGKFKSLKEAYKLRKKMLNMGFKGSFVAGFNNGERIGIKTAVELMNEEQHNKAKK